MDKRKAENDIDPLEPPLEKIIKGMKYKRFRTLAKKNSIKANLSKLEIAKKLINLGYKIKKGMAWP